jgi:hypothetical protein
MGKDDNIAAVEESVALSKLRLEYFEEGLCAQVMHIGPYATESATIERMREFMKENRYRDCVGLGSKHHEIYLVPLLLRFK